MDWLTILIIVIQCFVITLAVTTAFAYLTLFERRLLARLQHRVGPNRAGPKGFCNPPPMRSSSFSKKISCRPWPISRSTCWRRRSP